MNIHIDPLGGENLLVWIGSIGIGSYWLAKRYSWTVGVAFGLSALSALRGFQDTMNGWSTNPIVRELNLASESALISLILTVAVVQCLSTKTWVSFFKVVAGINAVAICGDALFHLPWDFLFGDGPWLGLVSKEPWGLLLNASMSGCLNAAIFPLLNPKEKALWWLVLISIVVTGRGLPIAVLCAAVSAWLLLNRRYKQLLGAVVASAVVAVVVKGANLFHPRGRDVIWIASYKYFREHLSQLFGCGLGGFYVFGNHFNTGDSTIFVWMHSDWMQTIFEQGLVGFTAVVLMYLHALRRTRKTPQLFAALVGFGAFAVANMPLRYPIAGIFGAVLIRWAFEKPMTESVLTS